MNEMDRKKVFGDALVAGVTAPVKGAVELVKSPIETSKNIAKAEKLKPVEDKKFII